MSHYSRKHASTLPYSSRHMSCVSKRERGSLGWQKIRPRAWQTALTVMHIRCIDRCTSSHCPGSSVTEGRKRLWKEAWKVGGGSRCFRAPWGWLLTDRPDPAGPDGLGGGPQVPRRVPLVLRADSCSFPWGETESKGERVWKECRLNSCLRYIQELTGFTSHGARLLSAGKQIYTVSWKRKQTLVQFDGFIRPYIINF